MPSGPPRAFDHEASQPDPAAPGTPEETGQRRTVGGPPWPRARATPDHPGDDAAETREFVRPKTRPGWKRASGWERAKLKKLRREIVGPPPLLSALPFRSHRKRALKRWVFWAMAAGLTRREAVEALDRSLSTVRRLQRELRAEVRSGPPARRK
jgi:hypothetical protein